MSDSDDDDCVMYCGACGLRFGMDDIADWDDVHCPDCDSNDIVGQSEME